MVKTGILGVSNVNECSIDSIFRAIKKTEAGNLVWEFKMRYPLEIGNNAWSGVFFYKKTQFTGHIIYPLLQLLLFFFRADMQMEAY